ncbi:TRAP transporter small permease subunit [Paracoccus sp. R12_1]|uniref:TRAP transporter small permease n=1 Tax=unclassified Paracoccus (in: a-proteobacteria) TaxID=2688777 RepID=UPI001ADA4CFD|nr:MULTISPECIES: TRAP transporter small permease [unclassified Paracoccus (in: a-proteobacteria)]MBO9457001.1 TRAP transporter small permease subunit [Paracoccus sp. R12_2]MBO9488114.1 TRAP transporter small permease subunit [Paracoccus sp. R12_1]
MIRHILDRIYLLAGYLAALFVAGIAVAIVIQMAARLTGHTFDSTEAAGFCLAASTFFGLAYTLRSGGHVRITLAIDRLPPRARRTVEVLNCLIASAGVSFLAWHVILLAVQSWQYHDISPGLLAIPFWIPQAGAALGVTIFAIALIDELIWILLGRAPHYDAGDETHYE